MKFYHVTRSADSVRDFMRNGVSTSKSAYQGTGFYLWTRLQKAIEYASDEHIVDRVTDGGPFILEFDIDFTNSDFDVDYEGLAPHISRWWGRGGGQRVADALGARLGKPPAISQAGSVTAAYPEGRNSYYVFTEPKKIDLQAAAPSINDDLAAWSAWNERRRKGTVESQRISIQPPREDVPGYSGVNETALEAIKRAGLMDDLEDFVFDAARNKPDAAGIPVKYVGPNGIKPVRVLDKDGRETHVEGRARRGREIFSNSSEFSALQLRQLVREAIEDAVLSNPSRKNLFRKF